MSTSSTDTYDQVGIREDLSDTIWNVSPEETPFASNCKKESVDNTYFEWQTDSLAAVSASTAVEGADASFSPAAATTRLGNYTEIITKTAMTSGSLEATDRAGRAREMAYQVIKRGKEAKRDLEHHLVGLNNARAAGDASTARETASYSCWANSNVSTAGTAGTGDGTTAAVDGTQRVFSEALLEAVVDSCWNNGGNPNVIMANSFNKRKLNSFSGHSDQVRHDAADKSVINAVSVYESDYGVMQVVPNRFVRARDVLVYEKDYWKIGELRGMKSKPIAATGDAEKRQIIMECGLMACNEASSGIILDLTTS